MYIGNETNGISWVDFKVPPSQSMFCFSCGLMGHVDENCEAQRPNRSSGQVNPRGAWLRSTTYGKRISERKDTRFHSNPMKACWI
jgi:hypothetical protein